MNKEIIGKMLVDNARKAMLENVDKIDDVKFLQNELKEHLKKEFDLQQQFEEKDTAEEVFTIWLTDKFNKTQDTTYLDVLMKYKKILERGKNANTNN